MCEIAILDPTKYNPQEIKGIAMTLYEAMHSSLGVVAVYDEGTKYTYGTYKAVDPDRDTLLNFMENSVSQGAHRVIIHGRMATTGSVCEHHAHPLEIDCPECDIDYLLHNGIVRGHHLLREQHEGIGHEYNTEVDSEAIAHDFGSVPTEFDGEQDLDFHTREPSFILLNEEAIFVQGTSRYRLSKHCEMALSYRRDFGPDASEEDYSRVIMTPTEAEA